MSGEGAVACRYYSLTRRTPYHLSDRRLSERQDMGAYPNRPAIRPSHVPLSACPHIRAHALSWQTRGEIQWRQMGCRLVVWIPDRANGARRSDVCQGMLPHTRRYANDELIHVFRSSHNGRPLVQTCSPLCSANAWALYILAAKSILWIIQGV